MRTSFKIELQRTHEKMCHAITRLHFFLWEGSVERGWMKNFTLLKYKCHFDTSFFFRNVEFFLI